MADEQMCPCGRPLHYSSEQLREEVQTVVDVMGPDIVVETPAGRYLIPRHFIALHGLKAAQVPDLAEQYGFTQLSS